MYFDFLSIVTGEAGLEGVTSGDLNAPRLLRCLFFLFAGATASRKEEHEAPSRIVVMSRVVVVVFLGFVDSADHKGMSEDDKWRAKRCPYEGACKRGNYVIAQTHMVILSRAICSSTWRRSGSAKDSRKTTYLEQPSVQWRLLVFCLVVQHSLHRATRLAPPRKGALSLWCLGKEVERGGGAALLPSVAHQPHTATLIGRSCTRLVVGLLRRAREKRRKKKKEKNWGDARQELTRAGSWGTSEPLWAFSVPDSDAGCAGVTCTE